MDALAHLAAAASGADAITDPSPGSEVVDAPVTTSPANHSSRRAKLPQLIDSVTRRCHCGMSYVHKRKGDVGYFFGCDRACSDVCLQATPAGDAEVVEKRKKKTPQHELVRLWMQRHTIRLAGDNVKTIMAAFVPSAIDEPRNTLVVSASDPDIAAVLQYLLLQGASGDPSTTRVLRLAGEACRAGKGDGFFGYLSDQLARSSARVKGQAPLGKAT
jgi:hypothetical protein